MRGEDDPPLAEQFRRVAKGVGRDGAYCYERICHRIAEDDSLLGLVASAPPAQRRPNILLAAVHYLLLSGVDDPLANHYPTVLAWRGDERSGANRAVDEADPSPAFAAFCARHREALVELLATRATQTNEVGRCTALLPALVVAAERAERPLAIVDIGASAGLNLLFDRYAYDFGVGRPLAGTPASPVVLRCAVHSGTVPTSLPEVAARVGIDLHPVDVRDDDSALWLLACQWPDHLDRFEVARAALLLAKRTSDLPSLVRGDAIRDIGTLVGTLPADAHLCLMHTWVAAYLTTTEQSALVAAVAQVAAARPVSWIFAEAPFEVPGLPLPSSPGAGVRGATAVVLVEHAPGQPEPSAWRIADMHPHGRWLRWYGVPEGAAG